MTVSRRQFLNGVGRSGGYGAAYMTMQGLGLLPAPAAYAGPPALDRQSGDGKNVAILGAGIAGLTAAYELQKAGYRCHILEARDRAGGRNWTLRNGSRVQDADGTAQLCGFDEGLYFNAGAARIPSDHHGIIGYCRAFGVPLEVFVNANRSAFYHNQEAFDGRPIESRQLYNDSAGHISELLAKALRQDTLDDAVTDEDKERLLAFLKEYGDLDDEAIYQGSSRAGYQVLPGAGPNPGKPRAPLELSALLNTKFWHWHMSYERRFRQQATMFQPVGGMDRIVAAFKARIGPVITYQAAVTELRSLPEGLGVHYRQLESGADAVLEADFCIVTLPLPALQTLETDFPIEVRQAIAAGAAAYSPTCKLAWQGERRFWEEDSAIFGGVSWTDREITQIWYPCSDYLSRKGILLGAYNFRATAEAFGKLSPAERAEAARISGDLIHPGLAREVALPISVAWQRQSYSGGGWVNWKEEDRETYYARLCQPVGRVFLAGEHLSYNTSWQEGAVQSAHAAITALDERARASRL